MPSSIYLAEVWVYERSLLSRRTPEAADRGEPKRSECAGPRCIRRGQLAGQGGRGDRLESTGYSGE